jgi:hypothetical protein
VAAMADLEEHRLNSRLCLILQSKPRHRSRQHQYNHPLTNLTFERAFRGIFHCRAFVSNISIVEIFNNGSQHGNGQLQRPG